MKGYNQTFKFSEYVNYDISNENWYLLNLYEKDRKGVFGLIVYFFIGILRFFYKLSSSLLNKKHPLKAADITFIVGSKNNLKSIRPLCDKLEKNHEISVLSYNGFKAEGCVIVPEFNIYTKALALIPFFLYYVFFSKTSAYRKKSLLTRMDRWCISLPYKEYWKKHLIQTKPRLLVVSNDHSVWTRTAMLAAKELNIRTIFVPHAPTGKGPADPIYDLALLDGVAQLQMYSPQPMAYLTGAIRYEKVIQGMQEVQDAGNKPRGLLICFNRIDNLEFIERVIINLSCLVYDGYEVFVKPHPADTYRFEKIAGLCEKNNVIFISDADSIIYFKDKVEYVLAGFSGVHLDSALLGKIPITIKGWYRKDDYYRFIENGLINCFSSLENLVSAIRGNEQHFDKVNKSLINYNIQLSNISSAPPSSIGASLLSYLITTGPEQNLCSAVESYPDSILCASPGCLYFTSKSFVKG